MSELVKYVDRYGTASLKWDLLERIYGESLVRRTAKICTQFGTMAELKWRLMNEA